MAEHPRSSVTALRRTLLGLPPAWWFAAALSPQRAQAANTGGLATKELDLPDFDTLVLAVPADVQIRIADRSHALIEAEQKVIDRIEFKHEGRTLRVRPAGSFETRRPIAIHITCRRLVALQAHASVDATLDGLDGDRLALDANDSATLSLKRLNLGAIACDIEGSATVTVTGKVRSQRVSVGGAGTYDAGGLKSESAEVTASGSSDVIIDSRDRLKVSVDGAATVRYAGQPRIEQSVEGAGTLEQQ